MINSLKNLSQVFSIDIWIIKTFVEFDNKTIRIRIESGPKTGWKFFNKYLISNIKI
jgi:hypothetical protein